MIVKKLVSVLCSAGLFLPLICDASITARQVSLDTFITNERAIAKSGILANIGDQGSKVFGAGPGIVIASPSKFDPNYFFTWTRDAALSMKCLVDLFIAGDSSLQGLIEDYVNSQVALQKQCTLSGCLANGGLGEPKYNADGYRFDGSWGRPQRDGPALRVVALAPYARWLVSNGRAADAQSVLWPLIQNDLVYVAQYWNQTGFDLWEEVNGSSFFTSAAQYRALVEGNALAKQLGKSCYACSTIYPQILCFLQRYWTGRHIDSNINVNDGRTGLDVNSILASIHNFDPAAKCNDATFQPCSSRMLANHKAVTDSFRSVYPINKGIPTGVAVAVGRYAEDVYYNGNPWYLATLATAEQLYDALYQWSQIGSITVDSTSLPFWRDIYASAAAGTFGKGSSTYNAMVNAAKLYADGFMAVVQQYTPSSGALAEQFTKSNGSPLSATDLTWSYAAFITAADRRKGVVTPTWGQDSASAVPNICAATSITGTYATPSATLSRPLAPCSTHVAVTFRANVQTVVGENIYIVGSISTLGSWNTDNAVSLSASQYTSDNHCWFATIAFPVNTKFEYKYIKRLSDGNVLWESDPNRSFAVSNGCGGNIAAVYDTWR